MSSEVYYKIIERNVAHEIIDGEAIVIHFDTGNYFSLNGISSQLWQWFVKGANRREVLEALPPLEPDQVRSFDEFVDSLVAEKILEKEVVEADGRPAAALPKYEAPFETPKFSKYNDMQNLLLSDPIHDVDETGWPNLDPDAV